MRSKLYLLIILIVVLVAGTLIWYYAIRPIQPAWFPATRDITKLFANTSANANGTPNAGSTPAGQPIDFPLTLPDGFRISLFAKDLPNVRVLAADLNGVLLVSSPKLGKVFALPDRNSDGAADETRVVLEGQNKPHGLAFWDGCPSPGTCAPPKPGDPVWLYVAETDGVSRYHYDATTLSVSQRERLFDLPTGGEHFTRTIHFGSDGKLYTTIGSDCNACKESDERRAAMLVSDPNGKNLRAFARGLRNTVFFTVNPKTGELWGGDMGRDWLGDNLPPEDVNIIRDGKHYGWPFCYGQRVHDDDFDKAETFDCAATEPPLIEMQAHSAPLGIAFIPDAWGADLSGDLLISYHGSWNRSTPTGYRVVRYDLSDERPKGPSDFLSGFLEGNQALGRPVDLLFSGSTLYVTDDKAGAVYRIVKTP